MKSVGILLIINNNESGIYVKVDFYLDSRDIRTVSERLSVIYIANINAWRNLYFPNISIFQLDHKSFHIFIYINLKRMKINFLIILCGLQMMQS